MSTFDSSMVDQDSYIPQIGTLNGTTVACAAGLATLAEMRKEGAYERLHGTGPQAAGTPWSGFAATRASPCSPRART